MHTEIANTLFWVCVFCFGGSSALILFVFPLVFRLCVLGKVEEQINQGIRYDESIYPAPFRFWSAWIGFHEVAWVIIFRWLKYKIKGEVYLGTEKSQGFAGQKYDVRLASLSTLIICWIFAISVFLGVIALVGGVVIGKYFP